MAFDVSWFALKNKNCIILVTLFELKWYCSLPQRCSYTSRKVLLGVQCIYEQWIKYKCFLTLVCQCLYFLIQKISFFLSHSCQSSCLHALCVRHSNCGCRISQFSKLIQERAKSTVMFSVNWTDSPPCCWCADAKKENRICKCLGATGIILTVA